LNLGDACFKIGSGATPRGGKDVYLPIGGVATLIRSQNVYNEGFERGGLVHLLPEHAEQLQNVEVQPGDILLNITGDSVARVCQVPDDVLPARVNQHVAIIRPNPKKVHPRFLRFYLASPQMQSHMLGMAAAGATRNALTKGMIEGFELPQIGLDEQGAIASVLGAVEDKIEAITRMNETLESISKSLFRDWFVEFGPVFAKIEGRPAYLSPDLWASFPASLDDKGNPVGWNLKQWGDLATLEYGKRLEGYKDAVGSVPVYGTNGVIGKHDTALCQEPGIVIGRKGAYRGVHMSDEPFYVIDTAFYLKPKKNFSRHWAYYTLCEHDINSMDSGSAIPSTSRDDFYSIPVIEPPGPLQEKFDETLRSSWMKQNMNRTEAEELRRLGTALLPQLMSGSARVSYAEKKVEEIA
jgi:type I restriction enzyme S subunit